MKKRFLFSASLLFLPLWLLAQSPVLAWQSCFGTSEDKDAVGAIAKVGDTYILSTSTSNNEYGVQNYHGGTEAFVFKLDSLGQAKWVKCFGGSGGEGFNNVVLSENNCFYLFGSTNSEDGDLNTPIVGNSDLWLVKVDSAFNIIWQRTFGCSRGEEERDAVATADGGVITLSRIWDGGYNVSQYYGWGDIWLCKFSATGVLEWEKTLGNIWWDNVVHIRKTHKPKETFYVIGCTEYPGGMVECQSGTGFDDDVIVYEIDRAGNVIWQQCYGGSGDDQGYSIIPLKDGFAFAANTTSNDLGVSGNQGYDDIWVVRCDTEGAVMWQKCFGGKGSEWPLFIDTTANGGFVIVGNTNSSTEDVTGYHGNSTYGVGGATDVWMLAVDSIGNLLWNRCYGSNTMETFFTGNQITRSGEFNYTIAVTAEKNNGDVECLPYPGDNGQDIWVFNVKDCEIYGPLTPSQPTGPTHACSASAEPARYTVPPLANQTHEWHLEPAEAGTLTTHGDTLTVLWASTFEGTATLTARGVNDCGESGWSAPFYTEVETCAGIATHSLTGLRLWPNPATGSFNLQLPPGATLPATLALSDLSGRVVLRQPLTETLSTVDCSRLVEGVYFWRVELDYTSVSGKLIIRGER